MLGGWLDRGAICASGLCLVHCLALPFALGALPLLAGLADASEQLHLLAVLVTLPVSIVAISAGRRRHGEAMPVILVGVGLALLVGGVFAEPALLETSLTVVGSMLLVLGHIANLRRLRAWGEAPCAPAARPVGSMAPQKEGA